MHLGDYFKALCERSRLCVCEEDCNDPEKCSSIPPCCDDYQCPAGYSKDDNNTCLRKASCGEIFYPSEFWFFFSFFSQFLTCFIILLRSHLLRVGLPSYLILSPILHFYFSSGLIYVLFKLSSLPLHYLI